MLYNIKTLPLHCVFHGIRFKVNEDWVSAIDTLLFFILFLKHMWVCQGKTWHTLFFSRAVLLQEMCHFICSCIRFSLFLESRT